MKLAIFWVFSIAALTASAKTGNIGDWIGDYNKCFDTAISNNRQSIDVQKTRDLCQSQVQRHYQLEDKDAKFVASFEKLSGSNRINLHIISEGQEKKMMIFYNGICLENPEPLKKLQLSAAEISDKLVGEVNLDAENARCFNSEAEPMFGFTEKDGKCNRICLDGEVLEQIIDMDNAFNFKFRCVRCAELIRESDALSEQRRAQYILTHTLTSPNSNECEDFHGCKLNQEYAGGKCRPVCQADWKRSPKTHQCEHPPGYCEKQLAGELKRAEANLSSFSRGGTSGSCRQAALGIIGRVQMKLRHELQAQLTECLKDPSAPFYPVAHENFLERSLSEEPYKAELSRACNMSAEEFMEIYDPPAAPARFLEDYPQ